MNTEPKTISVNFTISEILYLKNAIYALERESNKSLFNQVITNNILTKIKNSMTTT